MDFSSQPLLQTLTDALAALQPGAGVQALVFAGGTRHIKTQVHSGPDHALDRLPIPLFVTSLEDSSYEPIHDGWTATRRVMRGRTGRLLGVISVAFDDEPNAAFNAVLDGVVAHCAATLDAYEHRDELRRSSDRLFTVYQAGHLLHTSGSVHTIYKHVLDVLTRTLGFQHCAVLDLQEDVLVPVAHTGLDPTWLHECRIPLEKAFAGRVLASSAPARADGATNLTGLVLPVLDNGAPTAQVLCAPLSTRMGTLGFLEAYRAEPDPFGDDDLFVIAALAVELAAAVENAYLYGALREREDRLMQYADTLTAAQEEERRRVARDLHDGLGQMLVSSFQYMQAHEYSLPAEQPRAAFAHGLSILKECISETRRVMSDLRPSTLDDFGLVVALQQQLDSVAQDAGWHAQFRVDGLMSRLPRVVETTVFRVVQEALNNARKHAQTSRVLLNLSLREGEMMVEVQDWGKGFGDAANAPERQRGQGLGLMGMRERVALLGGSVVVHSTFRRGTTIRVTIPIAPTMIPVTRTDATNMSPPMEHRPARLIS